MAHEGCDGGECFETLGVGLPFAQTETEIKQIADYFYAYELCGDEELRAEDIGDDALAGRSWIARSACLSGASQDLQIARRVN